LRVQGTKPLRSSIVRKKIVKSVLPGAKKKEKKSDREGTPLPGDSRSILHVERSEKNCNFSGKRGDCRKSSEPWGRGMTRKEFFDGDGRKAALRGKLA